MYTSCQSYPNLLHIYIHFTASLFKVWIGNLHIFINAWIYISIANSNELFALTLKVCIFFQVL